jgi:hypothetical protein
MTGDELLQELQDRGLLACFGRKSAEARFDCERRFLSKTIIARERLVPDEALAQLKERAA